MGGQGTGETGVWGTGRKGYWEKGAEGNRQCIEREGNDKTHFAKPGEGDTLPLGQVVHAVLLV